MAASETPGTEQPRSRAKGEDYEKLLTAFDAQKRGPRECVRYLESQGYATNQARNAVYRFRKRHGLVSGEAKP